MSNVHASANAFMRSYNRRQDKCGFGKGNFVDTDDGMVRMTLESPSQGSWPMKQKQNQPKDHAPTPLLLSNGFPAPILPETILQPTFMNGEYSLSLPMPALPTKIAWNKKCTDLLAHAISVKTQDSAKVSFHYHGDRGSVCIRCPAQRLLVNLGQVYKRAYLASGNVERPPMGYTEKQWKKAVMERFVASMTAQETLTPNTPGLLSSLEAPSTGTTQVNPSIMNLPFPNPPPQTRTWTYYHKEILVESLTRICQIKNLPVSVSLNEKNTGMVILSKHESSLKKLARIYNGTSKVVLASLKPLSENFTSHAKEVCRAVDIDRLVALFTSTHDMIMQG